MVTTILCAVPLVATTPGTMAAAQAATVRGTVTLPGALKTGRRHHGYWRVENGNVPILPAPYKGDTVVVISGPKGAPPAAKSTAVEISGLQAIPSTVIVGEGSAVEFKNLGRVAHELSTADQSSVMGAERLAAGASRRQRFQAAGGYLVRCREFPHLAISVIVTDSPYVAVVDERGAFKLPDVPEGKATLKVWSQGRWVHEQEVEVGTRTADMSIKVGDAPDRDLGE